MGSNIFDKEQAERQKEQREKEAKMIAPAAKGASDKDPDEIIRVNISLSNAYKDRIQAYAKKHCMSVSVLIRTWIDEHCD